MGLDQGLDFPGALQGRVASPTALELGHSAPSVLEANVTYLQLQAPFIFHGPVLP